MKALRSRFVAGGGGGGRNECVTSPKNVYIGGYEGPS